MPKKKITKKKPTSKKTPTTESLAKLYDSKSVYISHWIRDYKVSKKFYNEVLELPINMEIPQAGWYEFKLPVKGSFLGLSQYREGEFKIADSLNISIKDVEGVKATLESKGVSTSDITDYPDMISMISIKDPDENHIFFIGPPRVKSGK